MESLTPTLLQLKQNAKLINRYLKTLGIDLSHSTSLDVSSNGFGFKNYLDAKKTLGAEGAEKKRSYRSVEDEFTLKFIRYGADNRSARQAARLSLNLGRDMDHFDWESYDEDFIPASSKVYSDFIYDLCEHQLGEWSDAWGAFMASEQRDEIIGEAIAGGLLYTDTIASIVGISNLFDFHKIFEKEQGFYGYEYLKAPTLIPSIEYITEFPQVVKMTKSQTFGCAVASGVPQEDAEEFAEWLFRFNGGYADRMLFYTGIIANAQDWKRWFVDDLIFSVARNYGKETVKLLEAYKRIDDGERFILGWLKELDEMIESGAYITHSLADALGIDFREFGLSAAIEVKRFVRANEEPRNFKDYYIEKKRVGIEHIRRNAELVAEAMNEIGVPLLAEDDTLNFMKEVQEKILDKYFSDQGFLSMWLPNEDDDYVHRDEDDKYSIDTLAFERIEELSSDLHKSMVKMGREKGFGVELLSPLLDCYKVKKGANNA